MMIIIFDYDDNDELISATATSRSRDIFEVKLHLPTILTDSGNE